MSDRELLELAAKAAGIEPDKELAVFSDGTPAFWTPTPRPHWWNPLVDDGDAFRLATKLKFRIFWPWNITADANLSVGAGPQDSHAMHCASENLNDDANQALRRAIVKAAAEIGKRTEACHTAGGEKE